MKLSIPLALVALLFSSSNVFAAGFSGKMYLRDILGNNNSPCLEGVYVHLEELSSQQMRADLTTFFEGETCPRFDSSNPEVRNYILHPRTTSFGITWIGPEKEGQGRELRVYHYDLRENRNGNFAMTEYTPGFRSGTDISGHKTWQPQYADDSSLIRNPKASYHVICGNQADDEKKIINERFSLTSRESDFSGPAGENWIVYYSGHELIGDQVSLVMDGIKSITISNVFKTRGRDHQPLGSIFVLDQPFSDSPRLTTMMLGGITGGKKSEFPCVKVSD